jgi:hypothetical protein
VECSFAGYRLKACLDPVLTIPGEAVQRPLGGFVFVGSFKDDSIGRAGIIEA